MQYFRYLGDDHTQIRLTENGPKTKVVQGEIVESELPATNFLGRRFEQVDKTGKKIVTEKHSFDGVSVSSSDLESKANFVENIETEEVPEAPVDTTPAEGLEAIVSKAPEAPTSGTGGTVIASLEPKEPTTEEETPVINVADEIPADEAVDGTVIPETVAKELTEKEEKEIIKQIKTFEKEEDFKAFISTVVRTPKIIDAIGFMQDAFEQA